MRFTALRPYAIVFLYIIGCFSLASAQAVTPSPAAVEHPITDKDVNAKVHLTGDRSTLPLVLVKGYPFLEGEVNGVKGKLLFDVGELSSFALNSHRVTPPDGKVIGRGFFGSGQTFSVFRFPVVDDLKLPGGFEYTAVPNVRGNSGQQLEDNITPDFIGWIGLAFFDGYVLKLDYRHPSAALYKDDANGTGKQSALKGERVLQVIHFDNTGHLNLPIFPVKLGSVPFTATIDTGSHDSVWLTPGLDEKLSAEHTFQCGPSSCTLSRVSIDNHVIALGSYADRIDGKAGFSEQLGRANDNFMTLGYEFLSKFKTVWDYHEKTLTLLSNDDPK